MAHAHHAEAVVEVEVLVAVHVPDAGALAALDVDRPRIALLELGRDAARHHGARALEVLARAPGALHQRRPAALGQRRDASRIDGSAGGGRHAPNATWAAGTVIPRLCAGRARRSRADELERDRKPPVGPLGARVE
jgi:hypothetical protein